MTRRWRSHLCAPLLGLLPLPTQAAQTLIWLVRDLPPLTIFEGPQKGQGAIDELLPMLMEHLPEYQHQIQHVNRARGMQMLQAPTRHLRPYPAVDAGTAPSGLCIPARRFPWCSNGVAIRQHNRDVLAPFIVARQSSTCRRSYGPQEHTPGRRSPSAATGRSSTSMLQQGDTHNRALHYGNDALGSLLQMQRLGRLEGGTGLLDRNSLSRTAARHRSRRAGVLSDCRHRALSAHRISVARIRPRGARP